MSRCGLLRRPRRPRTWHDDGRLGVPIGHGPAGAEPLQPRQRAGNARLLCRSAWHVLRTWHPASEAAPPGGALARSAICLVPCRPLHAAPARWCCSRACLLPAACAVEIISSSSHPPPKCQRCCPEHCLTSAYGAHTQVGIGRLSEPAIGFDPIRGDVDMEDAPSAHPDFHKGMGGARPYAGGRR